jgi:hypothetical protein
MDTIKHPNVRCGAATASGNHPTWLLQKILELPKADQQAA